MLQSCGKHPLQGDWGRLAIPAGSARGRASSHAPRRTCRFIITGLFGVFKTLLPYAGGGKGRPRPLHPRPRASPLGTPIRCDRVGSAWRGWLRCVEPNGLDITARHNGSMRRCCNRAASISCRGFGGRAAPPAGSARGRARSHAPRRICRIDSTARVMQSSAFHHRRGSAAA